MGRIVTCAFWQNAAGHREDGCRRSIGRYFFPIQVKATPPSSAVAIGVNIKRWPLPTVTVRPATIAKAAPNATPLK